MLLIDDITHKSIFGCALGMWSTMNFKLHTMGLGVSGPLWFSMMS